MALQFVVCMVLLTSIIAKENTPTHKYDLNELNTKNVKSNTIIDEIESTSRALNEERRIIYDNKMQKVAITTQTVETKPNITTETQPLETTSTETRPTETEPTETNPTEIKPIETKPAEISPTETRPTITIPTKITTDSSATLSYKEELDTASSQKYPSNIPLAYEVYENLVDIPDDRLPVGAVIGFTRPPVYNTVRPTPTTTATTNSTTDITTGIVNNIKNKKHCLDILHIKAEYNDKNEANSHPNGLGKVSAIIKSIKDCLRLLHKGFLDGIHSLFSGKPDSSLGVKQKRSSDISGLVEDNSHKGEHVSFVHQSHRSNVH